MEHIIEITGLKKAYGKVQAVDDIDFYVEAGTLFAFLGPNGAGKSTTIDMIATMLRPDEGKIEIDGLVIGENDQAIRERIGIVFQDSLLDKLLSVRENLITRGSFYGLKGEVLRSAVASAAETAGIWEFIDRPYGKLSGGQKRRADIARALVNTPKILFLDEPTTGLDPQTRKNVWETIRKLQTDSGMTVFLTTHYMEEAAAADYVVIIDHGKILAKGSPTELKDTHSSDSLRIVPKDEAALETLFAAKGIAHKKHAEVYEVTLKHTIDALPIIDACRDNLANIELVNGTMDDVFINITGKEIREG